MDLFAQIFIAHLITLFSSSALIPPSFLQSALISQPPTKNHPIELRFLNRRSPFNPTLRPAHPSTPLFDDHPSTPLVGDSVFDGHRFGAQHWRSSLMLRLKNPPTVLRSSLNLRLKTLNPQRDFESALTPQPDSSARSSLNPTLRRQRVRRSSLALIFGEFDASL